MASELAPRERAARAGMASELAPRERDARAGMASGERAAWAGAASELAPSERDARAGMASELASGERDAGAGMASELAPRERDAWAGAASELAGVEPRAVRVRLVGDGDDEALQEFVGGLSLRTRYLRFFAGVPRVTPAMLRRMSGTRLPGGDLVDALVVTEAGAIIGHGMATDTRDSAGTAVTEIGVVVADRWQRHGVGSALTRALAARAQARGATTLMMDVLAENRPMLALISKHLPAARSWQAGPYVTVHVPLPLTQEEQPHESAVRPHRAHDARDSHRQRQRERGELERGRAARAAAHLSVG